MALHNITGKAGEKYACRYLTDRGWQIRACNWRCGPHEIDIIAANNNILHFVEVKTRYSLKFGYPEEAVTKKKFNHLKQAAAAFLALHPHLRIQFDILSILLHKDKPAEYLLIEDVYI